MICETCKDQLSQFYVMKQRAKALHLKPGDIRKMSIIETIKTFLDASGEDCVVSKFSKLLAVHPATNSQTLTDQLFGCSSLLESEMNHVEDPIEYSIVEMKSESGEYEETYELAQVEVEDELSEEKPTFVIEIEEVTPRIGIKLEEVQTRLRKNLKSHSDSSFQEDEKIKSKRQVNIVNEASFVEQKLWIQQQLVSQKEVEGTKIVWNCSQCDFCSNKRGRFRQHLQKFHTAILMRGPNKHSCFSCRLRFDGENHLQVHKNCHRIFEVISPHVQYLSCDDCRMFFCSFDDLQIHINRHRENPRAIHDPILIVGVVHRNGESFLSDDDDMQAIHDDSSSTCGHCLMKFSSEDESKVHLMLYHMTVFTCPFDSREFPGIPTLSFGNHLRQCHPDIFPELEIKCSFCKMQFENVYEKLAHMKKCQAKMFQCDHCEKSFFRKADLQHHLKVVTGLMVFAW